MSVKGNSGLQNKSKLATTCARQTESQALTYSPAGGSLRVVSALYRGVGATVLLTCGSALPSTPRLGHLRSSHFVRRLAALTATIRAMVHCPSNISPSGVGIGHGVAHSNWARSIIQCQA